MLDGLSPAVRHLVLMLLPVVLGWAGTDLVPALHGVNPVVGSLAGVLVTAGVAWLTPFTTQYGVGSNTQGDYNV